MAMMARTSSQERNPIIRLAATRPPGHLSKGGRAVWRRYAPIFDLACELAGRAPRRSNLLAFEALVELADHALRSGDPEAFQVASTYGRSFFLDFGAMLASARRGA
jgi:hypothetical protein